MGQKGGRFFCVVFMAVRVRVRELQGKEAKVMFVFLGDMNDEWMRENKIKNKHKL